VDLGVVDCTKWTKVSQQLPKQSTDGDEI